MVIDEKTAIKVEKEYREVLRWAIKEEEITIAKLKSEGRWQGGLDGKCDELKYINQELKRKIKEIQKKYGISN